MFAVESDPGAVEQASLSLRMLSVKKAALYIREKIPNYTWQTRGWLLQALSSLGDKSDVPLLAGYLDSSDMATAQSAANALEELAGLNFGPRHFGLEGYPPQRILQASFWWESRKMAGLVAMIAILSDVTNAPLDVLPAIRKQRRVRETSALPTIAFIRFSSGTEGTLNLTRYRQSDRCSTAAEISAKLWRFLRCCSLKSRTL